MAPRNHTILDEGWKEGSLIQPLSLLLLSLVAGLGLVLAACGDDEGNGSASTNAPAEDEVDDSAGDDGVQQTSTLEVTDTVQLVKELTPSVVHIASEAAAEGFFGATPQRGVGTGFIIDEEGHIVTNNHVISIDGDVAESITVTLTDGRQFPAEVVGRDPRTDIAVLQIDADNLTPVELGNSSNLQVGEDVVAIGNALDLAGGPTVTRGVVSALNRVIEEQNINIPDAIQTDAAINPGNSGGPLINMAAQVVGITTAVIPSAEGIGLAISVDSARPIVNELIENGEINRGFLGVEVAPINPQTEASCGIDVDGGVLLADVSADSPADQAGLQSCDVIIELGGAEIDNIGDLFAALAENRAGDTVPVTYIRDGAEEISDVTLG
jgi:serine protease Do